MKLKTSLCALLLFCAINLPADGGGENRLGCYINCMDAELNLLFFSVDEKVPVQQKKGKLENYDMTTNVAIYDIGSKKTTYLFPDSLKEGITDFYFEAYYDPQSKTMIFGKTNDDTPDNVVGNVNLKERAACGKLIIVTWSFETRRNTLWTADKTGTNLKKICDYAENDSFDFDVKNQVFRFVKQQGKTIEVKDINYCQ